ncbi:AAA family ATPase [Nocardia sp. NPDC051750]|uniref:nucleotide-binding protein n=1 Tax=Nocardia sp. NPDC051750 TaxID=3364325 RepID=UPI00378C53A7
MTTDEHNPTSQPWPPSQPADTAGSGGESETTPPADPGAQPDPDSGPGATDTEPPAAAASESTADAQPAAAADVESPGADGTPWPADPAAGPWSGDPTAGPWGGNNGFAPPAPEGPAPAGNGAPYSAAPFDQFAPPVPGAFTAPAGEPFAHGSGQYPQPDPNQFPGSGQFSQPDPNQFQAGGQFSQPGPDQFQPANPAHGSGQFPQPDPNQFQPANSSYGSGQFVQPDPNQFQAGNFAPGGQFDQPYANQYQSPGPGQFDQQPGGRQAPGPESGPHGSGQFDQQPGGFPAPGPESGRHGSGQFPAPDPTMYPGQHNPAPPYPGAPGPDRAGQFDQAPGGGYAAPGSPEPGAAAAPDAEAGGPIYSWAPPPIPAAPPVQQQPYQQAPPPMGNPPSGQFQQPDWGTNPGQPAPQQQPQQQFQQPGQPQPGQFQPRHMTEPGQPGHSVNDLNLLKRARKAPRGGWRRAVHKVSRGVINPGESASDVVHRDLVGRVNAPVHGDFRIAILSLKGGVGKTTTTVGLGATFASLRGDRVIAIDANPDLGTLAHRVPRQTRSTVRNLLEDQNITRYSDVRAHTSQSPSRLEVLASEQDPAVSEAFSEADYRRAIGILQSFYNIILTDCGTGLMHSAMSGVLDMASSLVLVTSPAIDGARSASATLDWLDYHGYSHLVRQTVVVVNASRRGSTSVNLDHLRRLFLDRTRAVQVVPFDDHLAEGAEIDLELVSKPTRQALLELAAMVADDFANVDGYPYGNRY